MIDQFQNINADKYLLSRKKSIMVKIKKRISYAHILKQYRYMGKVSDKAKFNISNINPAVYLITNFSSNLPDDLLLIGRYIQKNGNNKHQHNRQEQFEYPKKICKVLFQTGDLAVKIYGSL